MRILLISALGVMLACVMLVSGAGQAQMLSTWSIDANSGCKLWNLAPQPNETVTWTGACRNGVGQGQGVLQWFEGGRLGDRYEGQLVDGKQTGHGVITSIDGRSYDGQFRDGAMSGHGIFSFPNGDRYDGEWRNGRPNGVGRFITAINGTLEGVWAEGCLKDGKHVAAVAVPLSSCH